MIGFSETYDERSYTPRVFHCIIFVRSGANLTFLCMQPYSSCNLFIVSCLRADSLTTLGPSDFVIETKRIALSLSLSHTHTHTHTQDVPQVCAMYCRKQEACVITCGFLKYAEINSVVNIAKRCTIVLQPTQESF